MHVMVTSIRKFKVKFPKGWEDIASKCKVIDFLNGSKGKRVVSDFYLTLKQFNGSRFAESFENAVENLAYKSEAYLLIDSQSLRMAYQSLETVLGCLENHIPKVESIKNVAICIFWVLHKQNVGL